MAANMDGVGELEIAENLAEFEMITCLTKQHDFKKLKKFKNDKILHKEVEIEIEEKFFNL
jgi:GMP reductase